MIHTPFGMPGAADFKPIYGENGKIIWEPTDHIATWKVIFYIFILNKLNLSTI